MATPHIMTAETIDNFIACNREKGATANLICRLSCATRVLYEHLPEGKTVTKERLLSWRKAMEDKGYASQTILNYVKYINLYLDYVGASDLRFTRGKPKDITGMTFGYLTAIEPTKKRHRKDIVWICKCKCGNIIELPATRMLVGRTLSCGCINKEHLQRANKYIDNTCLRQALEDRVESTRSASGYTGVTRKRGKWQAYITYKGTRYSLGCYTKMEDAVKARARAKQLVQEDALGLLAFYEEIHKEDSALPNKDTVEKPQFQPADWRTNSLPASAAPRSDNRSGYTGVSFSRNRWQARISYKGTQYRLGSYKTLEEAVAARKQAEQELKANPDGFASWYQQNYSAANKLR